jgi:hypothetical protein
MALTFEKIRLLMSVAGLSADYLNLMDLLWSITKFTALGFLASLVIVIVCVKTRCFRRKNRIWNIFSKFYYLCIPFAFMGAGMGLGTLSYMEIVSQKAVDALLLPVKQELLVSLQALPPEVREKLSLVDARAQVKKEIIQLFQNSTEKDRLVRFVNAMPASVQELVFEKLTNVVAEKIAESVNEKLAGMGVLEREILKQLWNRDIVDVINGNLLNEFVGQKAREFINGYKKMILYLLSFLLLIPAIDILIAKFLESRARPPSIQS